MWAKFYPYSSPSPPFFNFSKTSRSLSPSRVGLPFTWQIHPADLTSQLELEGNKVKRGNKRAMAQRHLRRQNWSTKSYILPPLIRKTLKHYHSGKQLIKSAIHWHTRFDAGKKRDGSFYASLNSFGLNIWNILPFLWQVHTFPNPSNAICNPS